MRLYIIWSISAAEAKCQYKTCETPITDCPAAPTVDCKKCFDMKTRSTAKRAGNWVYIGLNECSRFVDLGLVDLDDCLGGRSYFPVLCSQ